MSTLLLEQVDLTEEEFEKIAVLVKDLCGINLHQGKRELVKSRLAKRLRQLGMSEFRQYIDFVNKRENRAEVISMLDMISTNLTSFFREVQHFDFLSEHVIRPAVALGSSSNRRLRIWSAGCSTGEEPYSIAIRILEDIPNIVGWDIKILATDLSTRALATAKEGVYERDSLDGLGKGIVSKYFTPVDAGQRTAYRVKDSVKRLVSFGRLNLMGHWPMKGLFNVIFCRNVMIYFDKDTQSKLINRFWNKLVPKGIQFIGHSESLAGVQHRFRYVEPTVYERP